MNRNGQGIGTKSQSDHRGRRQGTYTLEHGVGRPGVGRDKDMETGIGHRHTGCEHKVGTRWDAKLLTLSVSVPAELQAGLRMATLSLSISLCCGEEYPGPLNQPEKRFTWLMASL